MPRPTPPSFSGRRAVALIALATAVHVAPSPSPAQSSIAKGAPAMHDFFTKNFDNRPVEVSVPRKTIVPSTQAKPTPRADVDARAPWISVWGGNARLNGRLPLTVPVDARPPATLWKAELPAGMSAASVLTAPDRAVVIGSGRWVLYDAAGKRIASEPVGSSEVEIDDRAETLSAAGMDGAVRQWQLVDGRQRLAIMPFDAQGQFRTRLATRGSRMIVVSQELDADVHAEPARKSMVEVIDLTRAPRPGTLIARMRDPGVLISVVTADRVVLATEGRVYFLDLELNFTDAWAGDFEPMGLSLDELDNVYLQAKVGASVQLWKLDGNGGRVWSVAVPAAAALIVQPPLIGYDHRVYLVSMRAIVALDESGRTMWSYSAATPLRGALVTPDGRLLASEGRQLVAFDGAGRRVVIAEADDALTTPPALAPGGMLFAATRTQLMAWRLPGH
jgi:hypothetical protein